MTWVILFFVSHKDCLLKLHAFTIRRSQARHNRTTQDKSGEGRAVQSKGKAKQDKRGKDKTRQDETRRDETRQDKTRQNKTGQAKTGQAKTGQNNPIQDTTRNTSRELTMWVEGPWPRRAWASYPGQLPPCTPPLSCPKHLPNPGPLPCRKQSSLLPAPQSQSQPWTQTTMLGCLVLVSSCTSLLVMAAFVVSGTS